VSTVTIPRALAWLALAAAAAAGEPTPAERAMAQARYLSWSVAFWWVQLF
jgi:hypothetical protein